MKYKALIGKFAGTASTWAGSSSAILLSFLSMIVFIVLGIILGFSEGFQIVWNTFMSAASYMILFLIQNAQNRDNRAIQLKLDELIYSKEHADNCLISIETLTDEEIEAIAESRKNRKPHTNDRAGS